MSSRRQRSFPLGCRYRQVSLYVTSNSHEKEIWSHIFVSTQGKNQSTAKYGNFFFVLKTTNQMQMLVDPYRRLSHIRYPRNSFQEKKIKKSHLCIHTGARWTNLKGGLHLWWRHQMETFSTLLTIGAGNSPLTCEFPAQRPVTRSFVVFFDLRLNTRLSKQSWGWWFEMPSRRLWRHCNVKGTSQQTTFHPYRREEKNILLWSVWPALFLKGTTF